MDSPSDAKENFSASSAFFPNYSNTYLSNSQPSLSNLAKKPKAKPKTQKGFPSSVRVGDWVCLICNNLNFSFRNECNRCQLQTKEQNQNQIQRMQASEYQEYTDNLQNRIPFKDVTNHKYIQNDTNLNEFYNYDHNSNQSPLSKENPNQASFLKPSSDAETREANINSLLEFNLCQGFENMLLVTPPRNGSLGLNSYKEYYDSNQKELPPYKSPKQLPSVSPILKEVAAERNLKEGGLKERKPSQYFTFLREKQIEQQDASKAKETQQLVTNSGFFHFSKANNQPESNKINNQNASQNYNV